MDLIILIFVCVGPAIYQHSTLPEVFLNSVSYLLHKLTDPYPKGISKLYPIYTTDIYLISHERSTC